MDPHHLTTVNDVFRLLVGHGHSRAMVHKRGAEWLALSSADVYRQVAAVARALSAWGLRKGDRVAILSENRPEWAIADFACLASGLVDVPIYPTLTAEQTAFILSDAGVRAVFCSTRDQLNKVLSITHGNLASNLVHSLEVFGLAPDDVAISCLPLSHITARHADYAMFQYGVTVAYCSNINDLAPTLLEVRPTFFVAVPRLYEKVRGEVERHAASPALHLILEWSRKIGSEYSADVLAGRVPASTQWKIANRLVFSRIAGGFGGRVRAYISGGAPLGSETGTWYASVGIRICEGYGLTETSPVIALNTPEAYRLGSVGRPLPNVECRIAADGELEVRGPSVFTGYWQRPEDTAAAFAPDGWFKTGDIGHVDADGFLYITDRKKDLIKTSGGKFIAPQPIENALRGNALVAQAAVIGDRRKFASVILCPHFPLLEDWARANEVPFETRAGLVSHPRVQALYEGVVDQVNAEMAQFEKIKRFLVVPDEWGVAGGELTPTLKLKRRVVEAKYRAQIDGLYAAAEKSPPEKVTR